MSFLHRSRPDPVVFSGADVVGGAIAGRLVSSGAGGVGALGVLDQFSHRVASAANLAVARRHFEQAPPGSLVPFGEGLWLNEDGRFFVPAIDDPLFGDPEQSGISLFASVDGQLLFFRPASNPSSLQELQAAQAERERKALEAEQAHAAFLAVQVQRPITLADVLAEELPTLHAAAALIVGHGGRIEAVDGELRILLPERVCESPILEQEARPRLHVAARVLLAAKEIVLRELQAGGKRPLVDRLPDRDVLAGGGVG